MQFTWSLDSTFLRSFDNRRSKVRKSELCSQFSWCQKRRIYDITNVLEGIGLIEKTSKNTVRWKRQIKSDIEVLDGSAQQSKVDSVLSYDRLENAIKNVTEVLSAQLNQLLSYANYEVMHKQPSMFSV